MKLVKVTLDGYRRFSERASLKIDSKLVALLGSNEAGKTSVLEALEAMNKDTPLKGEGPLVDTARGRELSPAHKLITLTWRIEKSDLSDLEALGDPPKGVDIRWLVVTKRLDGMRQCEIVPQVSLDLTKREVLLIDIADRLEKLAAGAVLQDAPDYDVLVKAEQFRERLKVHTSGLPDSMIALLRDLKELLSSQQGAYANTATRIADLIEHEHLVHWFDRARDTLMRRQPQFVWFGEADRTLEAAYNLREFDPIHGKLPQALNNLLASSNLDWKKLLKAEQSGNQGEVGTLLENAGKAMTEKLKAWKQSAVGIRFLLNNGRLLINAHSDDAHMSIMERSIGFRQYLALMALLFREGSEKRDLVLLIDEAESHLHYDAQADVVNMLAKQDVAAMVIYSTHSFGCLPEDLGYGVQIIERLEQRSEIVSRFWARCGSDKGVFPVLLGMGAATMAFLPMRACVLTEGPADMILYPALFKAAIGKDLVGFQIAPGLAEVASKKFSILGAHGNRIVGLVDGDVEGDKIKHDIEEWTKGNKEKAMHVFTLRPSDNESCVLEDLLDIEIYARSVNEELNRSGHAITIPHEALSGPQRPKALEHWCTQKGIKTPSSVSVAYRVRELWQEDQEVKIVDPAALSRVRALHGNLLEALNLSGASNS